MLGESDGKLVEARVLEGRVDDHAATVAERLDQALDEAGPRVADALVEELAMLQVAVLVQDVVRPLERDHLPRVCARVERQRRHERLEVQEVDRVG